MLQRGLKGLKVGYAMAFAIRWDSISPNLLEDGYGIRTIQNLLWHKGENNDNLHHVLNRGGRGVRSLAETLNEE